MIVQFIKDHGSSHDICCTHLEVHSFHLWPGVLKGVSFGLLVLCCCHMACVCGAVIATGFEMCSISPVESAIQSFDCVLSCAVTPHY